MNECKLSLIWLLLIAALMAPADVAFAAESAAENARHELAKQEPASTSKVLPDWQAVQASAVRAIDGGLEFQTGSRVVRVTALSPSVIRVRHLSAGTQTDRSFAVVNAPRAVIPVQVHSGDTESEIRTAQLRVRIRHQPFAVSIADVAGNELDADDPARGTLYHGESFRIWKRLRDDEQIYGFGEKAGHLNKRSMALAGLHYTMWNSDNYGYDSSIDPLYVSVPFYMVLRGGRAHGLFLDNTHRSTFDIGREKRSLLAFGAEAGELDYYLIDGPTPKEVIRRYTELTGRMPMPPRWALGYQQSRWSYFPDTRLRKLANDFRSRNVPADVFWLDIDHLQGFTPFQWNREFFPAPEKLLADLQAQGLHVVSIVDPHPKKQPGYPPYDSGLAGNHFIRNADGSVFEGPVWPSNDKQAPANSVFPDFTRAATRKWWGDLHAGFVQQGIDGFWNDMNEAAVFFGPVNTLPVELRHDNDGQPTDQREIHNVYGMLQTQSTREALQRLQPDKRPFVLTRATFAGGQRYAAVWTGDNTADWPALRQSVSMLLNMGISGLPFVGADIGGFSGTPSPELFSRWLQLGVFYPFMRAHTEQVTPDQEPWSYGPEHEAINRRSIELRYRLLPQLYSLMAEAADTGVPPMRAMFIEFPADAHTWSRQDQFMFGADLLVAPVLHEAARERELYLPTGDWHDYRSGELLRGGGTRRVPVTMESLPIYARAGAVIAEQPVVQHTGEMTTQPLHLRVFPASGSRREWYEDAGQGMAYRDGEYARRELHMQASDTGLNITISAIAGRWRPAPRSLCLRMPGHAHARHVRIDGKALASRAFDIDAPAHAGWQIRDGELQICVPDRAVALHIAVEH